jgi:NADH:ubiquinone oxidoreductase subunit 6 (subunit J)
MGAPYAAGLEVIVYAGAILVLFVFAVLMFGLGKDETINAPINIQMIPLLREKVVTFLFLDLEPRKEWFLFLKMQHLPLRKMVLFLNL